MEQYLKAIAKMNACQEALDWAEQYDSLDEAWTNCQRGDWMLWLIGKTIANDADKKPLVLIVCECARLALPYVAKGENRPLKAIETAEAWVRGEATIEEVETAAEAAAGAAAGAAEATAEAAGAAVLSQCADIVRKHYPNPPKI